MHPISISTIRYKLLVVVHYAYVFIDILYAYVSIDAVGYEGL